MRHTKTEIKAESEGKELMIDANVDPDHKGEMISAMIDLIKADLINEEAADD